MIIRNIFSKSIIKTKQSILILVIANFQNISIAQENFLLECNGYSWLEVDGISSMKKNTIKSYEIKKRNLVISEDEKNHLIPIWFNDREIFYSSYSNPLMPGKPNYFLQLDRISGFVKETFDSIQLGNQKKLISYWKYEGFCNKTLRKF